MAEPARARPSLRRTVLRLAASAGAAVVLLWSVFLYQAVTHQGTRSAPAKVHAAGGTGGHQRAAPAPVTTTTS
jgi:hypothetical protein